MEPNHALTLLPPLQPGKHCPVEEIVKTIAEYDHHHVCVLQRHRILQGDGQARDLRGEGPPTESLEES